MGGDFILPLKYTLVQHDFTQIDKRIFIINKMKCKASN